MTLGRHKMFHTPVGRFSYEPLSSAVYSLGMRRVEVSETQAFLIASPEKALIDLIYKKRNIKSEQELEDFLIEDRRINLDDSSLLNPHYIKELASFYKRPLIKMLAKLMIKRLDS
jgi:hypothetical protein